MQKKYHFCFKEQLVNLSADMVSLKPQYLNKDISAGPEMVHSAILREAASVLIIPFGAIFPHSLSWGTVLNNKRLAHIKPIPKSGRLREPSSYRPVALH